MKDFMYLDEIKKFNIEESSIALGNFDGVHKGHAKLIRTCVDSAREKGLAPAVFTFYNHPNNTMAGKTVVKNIMTAEEKIKTIEDFGIRYMLNAIFDKHIMKLSPEAFVKDILIDAMHCREAVCGFDYSFGFKAEGNPDMLRELGEKYGFDVRVIPEYKIKGITVSSTLIRKLIAEGRIDEYEDYTGRLYAIKGVVLQGKHLGRRIGFPTVNLNLSEDCALPANGVYITKTYVKNKIYESVTNVGNKPSVGVFGKNAETHIFDFDGDLYGECICVNFIKMLRPEKKFSDLEALSEAIRQDCIHAKEYFSSLQS